jgi:NAD-dependent aldehyde dehydrogenases
MGNIGHYINGNNVEGKSGLNKPVFNPATGTSENNVDLASVEEVNQAVENSKSAWKEWSNQPPLRRARVLDKFKYIFRSKTRRISKMYKQ